MVDNNLSKVLVVDDIESNIEFVSNVLELERIEIIGAFDGNKALELANTKKPDLILQIGSIQKYGNLCQENKRASRCQKSVPKEGNMLSNFFLFV